MKKMQINAVLNAISFFFLSITRKVVVNVFFCTGTKHGYHMVSFGLYVNEIVKRADPKGRPLWVIFDEDIAQEFGMLKFSSTKNNHIFEYIFN